jgi:hypothetical protein
MAKKIQGRKSSAKVPRERPGKRIHHLGGNAVCSPPGHKRGDKYLMANKKKYAGSSYRDRWEAAGAPGTFEEWLVKKGLL